MTNPSPPPFLTGVLRTALVVGVFVGGGVTAAALAGTPLRGAAPAGPDSAYPVPVMVDAAEAGRVWLVDGFNALHVSVLHGRERGEWWRAGGRALLVERLQAYPLAAPDQEVWVVFDGPRPAADVAGPEGLRIVFARSADDWLLRRVREAEDPDRVTVVTADRRLADRARGRGARVETPTEFLARCPAPGESAT